MVIDPRARRVLAARALRACADGCVAVLLPAYLAQLGLGLLETGVIGTLALAGSAVATLAVGALAGRVQRRALLATGALLMAATGLGFSTLSSFWPLAVVAFVGTLNPGAGDASLLLPLEQAELAAAGEGGAAHAGLFARYSLVGSLAGALGALGAALPTWLVAHTPVSPAGALRIMFVLYAAVGMAVWRLYRGIRDAPGAARPPDAPLGRSRPVVLRLVALFCVDSFASGLVVNSMLAAWLQQRFGMPTAAAAGFFFWAGLLAAASQALAPRAARRFGLLPTMVFTHIPASLLLVAAAFCTSVPAALACLLGRSALSQMDVPVRSAFVMAVVAPEERAAAAGFTALPKSLAAAGGPSVAGALLAGGWVAAPLLACGTLKIGYDLALLAAFRRHRAAGPQAAGT